MKSRNLSDFKIKKFNRIKKVERKEENFSSGIPEYICESCQKRYGGWVEQNICQECGGILTRLKESRR